MRKRKTKEQKKDGLELQTKTNENTEGTNYASIDGVAALGRGSGNQYQSVISPVLQNTNNTYGAVSPQSLNSAPNNTYGSVNPQSLNQTPNNIYSAVNPQSLNSAPNNTYGSVHPQSLNSAPNNTYGSVNPQSLNQTPNNIYSAVNPQSLNQTPNTYSAVNPQSLNSAPSNTYSAVNLQSLNNKTPNTYEAVNPQSLNNKTPNTYGAVNPQSLNNSNPSSYSAVNPQSLNNQAYVDPQGIRDAVLRGSQSIQATKSSFAKSQTIAWSELKIEKELGRGNYGVVYKGSFRSISVAVKELLNSNADTEQSFFAEASVWSQLKNHPNVVSFVGIITDQKRLAIVVEYLPNGTVESYYGQYKMDVPTVVKFSMDIARGMIHLAAEAVVHRDLACRNLLLDRNFVVKITDFGLARSVEQAEAQNQTKASVGPLKWMAPENILSKTYSTKSDVWAFGITCIEMLLSSSPYPNEDQMAIAVSICKGQYTHPIPSHCPTGLATILQSCWQFKPELRPSFEEILDKLEPIGNQLGVKHQQ